MILVPYIMVQAVILGCSKDPETWYDNVKCFCTGQRFYRVLVKPNDFMAELKTSRIVVTGFANSQYHET